MKQFCSGTDKAKETSATEPKLKLRGKCHTGGDIVRRVLMIANWKMNKSIKETHTFCREFVSQVEKTDKTDIVICPPFTSLHVLESELAGSGIKIGAQNLFWEENGAYTGEISAGMLLDAGCSHVIIGHSERRQVMKESDGIINSKIRAALQAGLIPILCVGETLLQREEGMAKQVVKDQLFNCLQGFEPGDGEIVIAYEPVWAIGTGVNASSEDAQEMIGFIRANLGQIIGAETAESTRILYGGSVNAKNIAELMEKQDIDGALVGGASLQPVSFMEIVRLSQNVE